MKAVIAFAELGAVLIVNIASDDEIEL